MKKVCPGLGSAICVIILILTVSSWRNAKQEEPPAEPQTMDEDWSSYFGGLTGAAVIYDRAENRYAVYNGELAGIRRSPCSTFKIISSLIGLEQGIILPEEYGTDIPVYGKTGMGKTDGITVDAWFTGFAETSEEPVYFCVYLGQSEERDATSARRAVFILYIDGEIQRGVFSFDKSYEPSAYVPAFRRQRAGFSIEYAVSAGEEPDRIFDRLNIFRRKSKIIIIKLFQHLYLLYGRDLQRGIIPVGRGAAADSFVAVADFLYKTIDSGNTEPAVDLLKIPCDRIRHGRFQSLVRVPGIEGIILPVPGYPRILTGDDA